MKIYNPLHPEGCLRIRPDKAPKNKLDKGIERDLIVDGKKEQEEKSKEQQKEGGKRKAQKGQEGTQCSLDWYILPERGTLSARF